MLALRRLRCSPHSVPACQTRLLRTRPRPIPNYFRQWDPALHDPRWSTKASRTPTELRKPGTTHNLIERPKPTKYQKRGGGGNKQNESRTIEHIQILQISHCHPSVRRDLKRLQQLLNLGNATTTATLKLREPLWKVYKRCTSREPRLPTWLSRRAWNVLWKSQYIGFSHMGDRQARLMELYGDLVKTRRFDLDLAGQVAYRLERKYMAGLQQEALEWWNSYRHQYSNAPEFLDAGARLYALEGFPDRAREIMDRLLELEPDWHVSVLLVVFRSYTSSRREQHLEEAREMYKAIKAKICDEGSIEIYDNCLLGFLEARSLPDARKVFRDMVEAGHLDYNESESQIQKVLRRLNRLYALATDISSMSSIALDAIAILPVAYHGHLFSDWMKFALSEESPVATAQILDLMIERGYQPETGHFEFLLRALFRTGEPDNILKAENLGWKMVEAARLSSTLTDRGAPKTRLMAIKEKLDNASVLDTDSSIQTPPANTPTFALLMDHHDKRLQWEHVDFLTRQLREANVAPDCTIMNVLMNHKIRQGKFLEAWRIYRTLTGNEAQEGTIFPDGATIRCLFKILRVAYDDPTNLENPDLPKPRELLRETVDWWHLIRRRPDAGRFTRGLIGLRQNTAHRLILHCFSYAKDLAGTLVALHFLRTAFKVYPTEKDAAIFLRHIAYVPLHDETDSVRRQFSLSKHLDRNMDRLTRAYERVRQRRLEEVIAGGQYPFPMTEAESGDLELNVISEFVRTVLLANRPPEAVELMIQAARQEIGVPDLRTGDADAFDLDDGSW